MHPGQFSHTWYQSPPSYANPSVLDSKVWGEASGSEGLPAYAEEEGATSDVLQTIESEIKELSSELRKLSLDIWGAWSRLHS